MARHHLAVFFDGRERPGLLSVCVELARRRVDIVSLQTTTSFAGASGPCIQLVVNLPENGLEILVKRLNRLIDVVRVIDLSGHAAHRRMSMFVTLRTGRSRSAEITELVIRLRAEIVEARCDNPLLEPNSRPPCGRHEELSRYGIEDLVECPPFGTCRLRNLRQRVARAPRERETVAARILEGTSR